MIQKLYIIKIVFKTVTEGDVNPDQRLGIKDS